MLFWPRALFCGMSDAHAFCTRQALKADILLIVGIKPESEDGTKCLQALENALLDFLSNITARPDKKINKNLMTHVETELEQAKHTISNLRDTQMRQETILRQYAEEVIAEAAGSPRLDVVTHALCLFCLSFLN